MDGPDPKPGPARTSAVGLALAATLLALAGAELLLRFAMPVAFGAPPERPPDATWRDLLHRPSRIPGLRYELVPGRVARAAGTRVRINAHGMRDEEPLPLAPDLTRVAVLGDSFTFGFNVAARETYPSVLEELLCAGPRRSGRPCDVLNFGVGGYSSLDEAAQLRHRVLGYEPDAVVVGYVLNDPETAPIQPLHAHFAPVAWWQHVHLLRLVQAARSGLERRWYGGGDYYRYLHSDPETWGGVERAFSDLAAVGAERDLPILVVVFPLGWKSWESYPYAPLHRQVVRAARAAGLEAEDLLPRFARHPAGELRAARGDPHPSALGHEIAARAIQAHLLRHHAGRLGLGPQGRSPPFAPPAPGR